MSEQDVSIFTQCLRGYGSVAPVGKNVIHPDQVLCELNDVSACPSNENTFSAETTDIDVSDSLMSSMCGDKTRLQQLKERREQYLNEERELGGSFNIFNNEVPKFKSIPIEDEDLNKTPVQCAGSQGRIGEGCSTPKDSVDHTFGPLRRLDLSEVADITTHLNLPKVLTECTNNDKRARKDSTIPEKRSSETFVLPKSNEEATFLVPKPIRRVSKPTGIKNNEIKTPELPVNVVDEAVTEEPVNPSTLEKEAVEVIQKALKETVLAEQSKISKITSDKPEQTTKKAFFLDREESFVVPEKLPIHAKGKISSSAREKREQNRKNQSSLLEDLHMDINSPGRIMFGSRPAKKVRELPPTPVQNSGEEKKNLFGLKDKTGSLTIGSKSSGVGKIPETPSGENLVLTLPTTIEEDDVQPDIDMSTPKRSTGSQRTHTIQAVVNRLYQSPSRRPQETLGSKKTISVPTPSKDESFLTPPRPPKLTRTEITPNANFMKPTLSSVLRTSLNSGKRAADVSKILQESVLKTPTSNSLDCTQIMCERQMNSGIIPRFQDTTKFDRSKLERVRLFPNDSRNETFTSTREANLAKSRTKRKSHFDETVAVTERRSCVTIAENLEESYANSLLGEVPDCYDESRMQEPGISASTPSKAPDAKRLLTDSCCTVNTPSRSMPKLNFGDDDDDDEEDEDDNDDDEEKEEDRLVNRKTSGGRFDGNDGSTLSDELFEKLSVTDDEDGIISIGQVLKRKKVEIVLKPREIIKPTLDDDSIGLRRSTRNRMKPIRDWLGEKPVYAFSPSGGRRLVGSTSVVIRDPTLLKARSLDINIITDQQIRENAKKRKDRARRKAEAKLRKARKVKHLRALHRKGENLDVTVDSIITSSDEDSD